MTRDRRTLPTQSDPQENAAFVAESCCPSCGRAFEWVGESPVPDVCPLCLLDARSPVVTATVGTNADLMAEAARLYLAPGWRVADVTYGKGVFWQKVDTEQFDFLPTDITTFDVDFRKLPYAEGSLDALVLDPPYTPNHDNDLKRSVAEPYNLDSGPRSTPSVVALYAAGISEAGRCLRRGGRLFVKCQDGVENHRRHWTHINVLNIAEAFGFDAIDKFVLVQQTTPAMRQKSQKRARSNHSYLWVFERKGFPW